MYFKLGSTVLFIFVFLFINVVSADPISAKCECPVKPWGTIYYKQIDPWSSQEQVFEIGAIDNQNFCLYPYPACVDRTCTVEYAILKSGEKKKEQRPCSIIQGTSTHRDNFGFLSDEPLFSFSN